MDPHIQELLKELPAKAPRSKLEPYSDVIRELRRRRRTYEEIASFFGQHLGVKVAASTIHAYVKVRAKRPLRSLYEMPSDPQVLDRDSGSQNDSNIVNDRIDALKQRPSPVSKPSKFQFQEGDPLTLTQGRKARNSE